MSANHGLSTAPNQAFVAWPGWQVFKITGILSGLFLVIFYGVYGFTDYLTGLHNYRIPIHFDWELRTPLITSMSLVYSSVSPMLLLAPFVVRDLTRFKLMFKIMVTETLVAGLFFILVPVKSAYPEVEISGAFVGVFKLADALNLTHNELPSLHVAFAVTVAYFYAYQRNLTGKIVLWTWATLLAASTMLTHQHYLLSVTAGALLSSLVLYFMVIKHHTDKQAV